MDSEFLQGFLAQAEGCLPLIRNGIIVSARTGNAYGELNNALRQTTSIKDAASIIQLDEAAEIAGQLEAKLKVFARLKTPLTDEQARGLLDQLSELETTLARVNLNTDDFSIASADSNDENNWTQQFEADEETLKIFAEEAEEIVAKIGANLEILENQPRNRQALLEIRRSAHTLKGSAGIVGLKMLADVAHRVEDLLDYLAESETEVGGHFFEVLCVAADCFGTLASGENSPHLAKKVNRLYEHFDALAATLPIRKIIEQTTVEDNQRQTENSASLPVPENSAHRSIVRVSLEKLDDLEKIMSGLVGNRNEFQQTVGEFTAMIDGAPLNYSKENLETLFENQQRLIEEMRDQLLRLRMIRFGSLAVRLQRAVRVAAEEAGKSAELIVENETLEVDTQMLDSLIEPLTHLLRNAVAHGIESADARRSLGKPETGRIVVAVAREKTDFVLTVSDDGRGISAAALKTRALRTGVIGATEAETMSESEAFELIYLAGLTTAEEVNRLSGRGVGMNIVKTAVMRQRGAISIASEINRGTTFTIRLPIPAEQNVVVKTRRLNTGKLSVMIVDDSQSVRHHVSTVIERAGWTAIAAHDGLDALDILQDSRALPDVILSDVEMPRINGSELLATLKERENLREIPVVMVTSRLGQAHRQAAFDLGAAEYLTKPFDDENLIETIKSLTA